MEEFNISVFGKLILFINDDQDWRQISFKFPDSLSEKDIDKTLDPVFAEMRAMVKERFKVGLWEERK